MLLGCKKCDKQRLGINAIVSVSIQYHIEVIFDGNVYLVAFCHNISETIYLTLSQIQAKSFFVVQLKATFYNHFRYVSDGLWHCCVRCIRVI